MNLRTPLLAALSLWFAASALAIEPLPPVTTQRQRSSSPPREVIVTQPREAIVTPQREVIAAPRREVIATPQAVPGMRFVNQESVGPSYMVRTGNIDGGNGAYNGVPEPCPNCQNCCPNVCADWTLMPWYAPWPVPRVPYGYRQGTSSGYYMGF